MQDSQAEVLGGGEKLVFCVVLVISNMMEYVRDYHVISTSTPLIS